MSCDDEYLRQHHCMTGIVFCALAIEAMINHYGKIYFRNWNEEKGVRKELHKKVFTEVNLPCYLGTKNYQNADDCFKLRDKIVHGKTTNEEKIIDMQSETNEESISDILRIRPDFFYEINIETLEKYIDTARNIQDDIENNGFYPDKIDPITGEKEKLGELPLSNSGVYEW